MRTKNKGFTLIELMVTIAIVAILLGIAVPSYQTIILNNRMVAQSNDLLSALQLARSEAVRRGTRVSVCTSANGTSCNGVGNNWAQGWIVFVDGGTAGTVDSGDLIVRAFPALIGNSTLVGSAAVAASVSYRADGFTTLATGANATISLCPPAPAAVPGRDIQLSASGRARVQSPPSAACA